jgi:integrase
MDALLSETYPDSDLPIDYNPPLREAFELARQQAGLKPIKIYNLRRSYGMSLAAKGVDVRTIQTFMRHTHLNTTEQYIAYAPRPELANQITRALDPHKPARERRTAASCVQRRDGDVP